MVPWALEARTGGTVYDAHMVAGLRARGWSVAVLDLGGDASTGLVPGRAALAEAFTRVPDGAWVIIDGLGMAEAPEVVGAQRARIRMVALVHQLRGDVPGVEPGRRDELHALERAALAAAHGVIVTSAFSARRLAEIGVHPALIRTVLPGTARGTPATGPGPGRPPRLLCVGAVTYGKGQDVLVRALARLVEIPWTCVLAGDVRASAGFVEEVEVLIERGGLSDRVELVGSCDEATLEALYRVSSLFVLPSRYEAYGMALTEAMARGLPVVTTTAGAIPETAPPPSAILVPPGDDAALADALRSLLLDAPGKPESARRRRASLGAAALRHASGLPDWDESAEAFAAAVTDLAGLAG